MSWIYDHQRHWRIALLVGMVIALMGPWAFDRINVPAKYACSHPNIRLEGDFCGLPIPGIQAFTWAIIAVLNMTAGLITHKTSLTNRGFEFLISLLYIFLMFLLILPFINTIRSFIPGFHPRRQLFTIIAWVLAIGIGLFVGFSGFSNFSWSAWGIWLYIALAVCGLLLEGVAIFKDLNT